MTDRLSVRDALLSFAPGEQVRGALFLTYSFDGRWFEEALVPDLCERPIATMLVVRDRNAVGAEARSVRYHRADACRSPVFHPKLCLLVGETRARAVVSSANLTRGGFERQSELGRVFDLAAEASPDAGIFVSLLEYLRVGLATELGGAPARDLVEIAGALEDVVKRRRPSAAGPAHVLLHNYARPIWSQVLDRVPHHVLRRALIVSPFYEPDRRRPEDPATAPEDASIFRRLIRDDFSFESPEGESPLRVFFRQSEGRTELPIHTVTELGTDVELYAQDEREPRLHAKLLLLEGAGGSGRDPYFVALHGSPNFTAAGLLNRPPFGNSELAVMTTLPATRKSMSQCVAVLGLDQGFSRVESPASLTTDPPGESAAKPSPGVVDATFHVADRWIQISLLRTPPEGACVRILMLRDGTWQSIGEADAAGATEVRVPVSGLAEIDERTALLEVRATTIRVELVAHDGAVLSSEECPVNVDTPGEFCGMTLVGAALLSLDERIARSGAGLPPTYREKLTWLEARRAEGAGAGGPSVSKHQADLDRFYRNVHVGLRGILARSKASPGSEFSARRSLDDLSRWSVEATESGNGAPTVECRLFLVDRLLRAIGSVLDGVSARLRPRLPAISSELSLVDRIAQVAAWLELVDQPALAGYVDETEVRARRVLSVLGAS